IVTSVLENRSPAYPHGNSGLRCHAGEYPGAPTFIDFTEPVGLYRWAVADSSRISDRTVYPYVVQYNESDFTFLSRLLEHEGLTYYFEHLDGATCFTITDRPGHAPLTTEEHAFPLLASRRDVHTQDELVHAITDPRRLRSGSVTVRNYDWR